MSFLNAAMALGALAFVVPLAIHLLFRSRFRSLDWGAMFLLQDIVQTNRRRMQWHQWILLALRCAIPILLAFAMARPLISAMRTMAGSEPISLVLIVDDSRSMSAAQRASTTMRATGELLQSLSRKDEVIVIATSQLGSVPEAGAAQDARMKLRALQFDGAPVSLDDMLHAGLAACEVASHPFRRMVVCSDFQDGILSATSDGLDQALVGRWEQARSDVELDFLNVAAGEDPAQLGNVFVESIEYDQPAIMLERPVRFSATIRNLSDAAMSGMRCSWSVDGVNIEETEVSIPARSTTQLHWNHAFARAGGASVALSVEHHDTLLADNRRRLAVNVLRNIRVWLVDGNPSNQPLKSETGFLKVALSPFAFQASFQSSGLAGFQGGSKRPPIGGLRRDIVSTRVLSFAAFSRAFKQLGASQQRSMQPSATQQDGDRQSSGKAALAEGLSDIPDLIVLANLKLPPGANLYNAAGQTFAGFLADGGNVVVFDGDRMDQDAWAACDWLPATPLEVIERGGSSMRMEPPGAKYAAWSVLSGSGDSLLDTVEVRQMRRLQLRDNSTVMMRTESGDPFVVEHANGKNLNRRDGGGRVVQFAIPCSTAWSNLPLRPVFLPLVQQLVLDLAGGAESLNGKPGETFRIQSAGMASGAVGSNPDERVWRVTGPRNQVQTRTIRVGDPLVFDDTSDAGVYRFMNTELSGGSNAADDSATSAEATAAMVRVIEVPASESRLRTLESDRLMAIGDALGGSVFDDAGSLIAATRRDRFGLEVWRPLIWLLLVVMVAEVLWQQRRSIRSRLPNDRQGVAL
ncbi:N-terminal double-transmembrane domain-containing protein [Neorhodopirellula lusitana]|uniref:N-terminal double-transmembrane domain-containing protein n=1 Tax=Neorhodopirellula lusitana TaxID=445327 RepID=A0ABY1PY08_9BACT|nr:BatA domain-containing protein [Neorhodopirellula lusitana]SMP51970.1 N-terminal double-transmembrane domain-containing protein [Neorhodopirellula lusitana]